MFMLWRSRVACMCARMAVIKGEYGLHHIEGRYTLKLTDEGDAGKF